MNLSSQLHRLTRLSFVLYAATLSFNAFAATPVFVDPAGVCNSQTPCFTTVQAGVDAVSKSGQVRIYPGNYPEAVDLSSMNGGSPGSVVLQAVNAFGLNSTVGVTIDGGGSSAIDSNGTITGNLGFHGLNLKSSGDDGLRFTIKGNVDLSHIKANGTGGDGIFIEMESDGSLLARDIVANDNNSDGMEVEADESDITLNLTFERITTHRNGSDGLEIDESGSGHVININMDRVDANNNIDDGIEADTDGGVFRGFYLTAEGNGQDGVDVEESISTIIGHSVATNNNDDGFEVDFVDSALIAGVRALRNGDGILFEASATSVGGDGFINNARVACVVTSGNTWGATFRDVNESSDVTIAAANITNNTRAGVFLDGGSNSDSTAGAVVKAPFNWWNDATGPTHTNNAGGTGDIVADGDMVVNNSTGTVTYDNFLDVPVEDLFDCATNELHPRAIPSMNAWGTAALIALLSLLAFFAAPMLRRV